MTFSTIPAVRSEPRKLIFNSFFSAEFISWEDCCEFENHTKGIETAFSLNCKKEKACNTRFTELSAAAKNVKRFVRDHLKPAFVRKDEFKSGWLAALLARGVSDKIQGKRIKEAAVSLSPDDDVLVSVLLTTGVPIMVWIDPTGTVQSAFLQEIPLDIFCANYTVQKTFRASGSTERLEIEVDRIDHTGGCDTGDERFADTYRWDLKAGRAVRVKHARLEHETGEKGCLEGAVKCDANIFTFDAVSGAPDIHCKEVKPFQPGLSDVDYDEVLKARTRCARPFKERLRELELKNP
ncbi:MAG: hypothetical protein V1798_06360 [Pseudomonadota bacterium]